MLTDLVVDTNVLVHANNDNEQRQESSINLINYLLSSSECICLDEGFSLNETLNESYIGYEYLKHLKNGQLGYTLISILAQTKRITLLNSKVNVQFSRKINQCMSNNHDRVFIKVAMNSVNKILVTHDFTDFSGEKRKYINKTFSVDVLVAKDIP